MFDIFSEVKKNLSSSGFRKPCVSSSVFQTMNVTMLIAASCFALITARNYIGDNISCITGFSDQTHRAVENYCFISATFTVPGLSVEESAHPGVGPLPIDVGPNPHADDTGQVTLHSYYQWVPIVLALQALSYYLPQLIWNQIDKGYFETTLCHLNEVHVDDQEATLNIEACASYTARTMRQHMRYTVSFLVVEIFALIVAVSNLFLTNVFLGGEFFQFGPNAIRYFQSPAYDYNNPLNQVFPKMAKCTWHKYGPSGSVETYDAMCVLPLNIVNEKTYVLLWFTYILTVIIAGIFLLWHIGLFIIPAFRNYYLMRLPMKDATRYAVGNILKKGNVGDWFLMWNYKSQMMYFGDWARKVNEKLVQ